MKRSTVGIVGVGPRGLSILERIIAFSLEDRSRYIQIHLFDPNIPGSGCHSIDQPDHLLVNTVAEQITQFSDPSVKNSGPIVDGPSFYEWLLYQSEYKKIPGKVSPDGYYSRSVFGKYLNWVFDYLVEMAPDNLSIEFHRKKVIDLDKCKTKNTWNLYTNNKSYPIDYLFLTTGHTAPEDERINRDNLITNPYPVNKLDCIPPNSRVAVEGMGLTFFDVISHLTTGRGGVYKKSNTTGRLEYIQSCREPKIIAYSRSGLPLSAKAVNQKGVSGQYQPHFFTSDKVEKLKKQEEICFISEILPELLNDMKYAYYFSYIRKTSGFLEAKKFCTEFKFLESKERELFLENNVPKQDRFTWEMLSNPVADNVYGNNEKFNEWFRNYLEIDLKEAKDGNLDSPLKSACDVLRDLRDNIRSVIDFGKLTEESQRWLYTNFIPVMNRIAVGPPKERIEEVLALMDSGVLICDLGPLAHSRYDKCSDRYVIVSKLWPNYTLNADFLIKARIPMHSPKNDESLLIKNLLNKGYARLFYNGNFHPGGLEIDQNLNLISKSDESIPNAWVLGMPSEGAKFYTFIVPRPGVNSTAIVDAGNAVKQMLLSIDNNKLARYDYIPTLQVHNGVVVEQGYEN